MLNGVESFEEFIVRFRRSEGAIPRKLVSFDPGGTTGIAVFEKTTLVRSDQLDTSHFPEAFAEMEQFLKEVKPSHLVIESYRLYGGRTTESQVGSDLPVAQLIGVIRFLALKQKIPVTFQSAQQGKAFMTDEKLRAWGLYKPGKRHAMDAVRHACHFLLFHGGLDK